MPALSDIERVAAAGKAVLVGTDASILAIVKSTIECDRSASFYLTREQAKALKDWYWTPERLELTGLTDVPEEDLQRIRDELGVEGLEDFRYAPLPCECGNAYGAYDFFRQGIAEHGIAAVNAVFALEHATFFRVNPTFVPICPACDRRLELYAGGGWYDCAGYGGCCCCARVLERIGAA